MLPGAFCHRGSVVKHFGTSREKDSRAVIFSDQLPGAIFSVPNFRMGRIPIGKC